MGGLDYVMPSRTIVIHSLAEARAAVAAAHPAPVTLQSMPGAGASAGIAWFGRIVATVRAEFPRTEVAAILDCDDAPGAVMAALRWLKEPGHGPMALAFSGDAATAARLEEMAAELGVRVIRTASP